MKKLNPLLANDINMLVMWVKIIGVVLVAVLIFLIYIWVTIMIVTRDKKMEGPGREINSTSTRPETITGEEGAPVTAYDSHSTRVLPPLSSPRS